MQELGFGVQVGEHNYGALVQNLKNGRVGEDRGPANPAVLADERFYITFFKFQTIVAIGYDEPGCELRG